MRLPQIGAVPCPSRRTEIAHDPWLMFCNAVCNRFACTALACPGSTFCDHNICSAPVPSVAQNLSGQAPPSAEVATVSDGIRVILACQDENILVALRDSVGLAGLARLHDLVGSHVFTELVNFWSACHWHYPRSDCKFQQCGCCAECLWLGFAAGWRLAKLRGDAVCPDPSDGDPPTTTYQEDYTLFGKTLDSARAHTTRSPGPLPYAGLFCLHWDKLPRWLEVQEPVEALKHLAVKFLRLRCGGLPDSVPPPDAQG